LKPQPPRQRGPALSRHRHAVAVPALRCCRWRSSPARACTRNAPSSSPKNTACCATTRSPANTA
jgi:hypothetical protein